MFWHAFSSTNIIRFHLPNQGPIRSPHELTNWLGRVGSPDDASVPYDRRKASKSLQAILTESFFRFAFGYIVLKCMYMMPAIIYRNFALYCNHIAAWEIHYFLSTNKRVANTEGWCRLIIITNTCSYRDCVKSVTQMPVETQMHQESAPKHIVDDLSSNSPWRTTTLPR